MFWQKRGGVAGQGELEQVDRIELFRWLRCKRSNCHGPIRNKCGFDRKIGKDGLETSYRMPSKERMLIFRGWLKMKNAVPQRRL